MTAVDLFDCGEYNIILYAYRYLYSTSTRYSKVIFQCARGAQAPIYKTECESTDFSKSLNCDPFRTQKHLKSIGFFLGTHDAVAVKVLHTPSHRCIESCARCPNLKKNDWRHRSLSTSVRTLGRPNTVASVVCNLDEKRSPPSFNPTLRSRQNTVTVDLGSIRTRRQLDRKPLHRRHFSAHFAIIILTWVIFVTPVGIEVAAPLDQATRVLIVSLRVSLPSVLCIVEIVVKLKDSRKRRATLSGRLMWEEPVWGSGESALRAGQFWVAHSPVRTARMTCYFTSPHGPASEMVRFRAATIKKIY